MHYILPLLLLSSCYMYGMHTAYTGTELQTASGFADSQQITESGLFNKQIKKCGAKFAWKEFSEKAQTHTVNQLHAEYQYKEQPYLYNFTSNQQGAFCTASVAEDLREKIFAEVFDGNEAAYQKFTDKPYAYALLDVAYAIEGAHKNPIDWLTAGDRYGASKKLQNVCIKLNNAINKKELCKLSLHDEYILQTELPESVARKLGGDTHVSCQLTYKERMWPAIKQSASAAAVGALFGFVPGIVIFAGGAFSDKLKYVQDYSNIIQHAPLPIRYLAGHDICILFPACLPPIFNIINSDKIIRLPYAATAFLLISVSMCDYYKKNNISSNAGCHSTVSAELIGGALGSALGFTYALGKMSAEYPKIKKIKDIKQLSSNN